MEHSVSSCCFCATHLRLGVPNKANGILSVGSDQRVLWTPPTGWAEALKQQAAKLCGARAYQEDQSAANSIAAVCHRDCCTMRTRLHLRPPIRQILMCLSSCVPVAAAVWLSGWVGGWVCAGGCAESGPLAGASSGDQVRYIGQSRSLVNTVHPRRRDTETACRPAADRAILTQPG